MGVGLLHLQQGSATDDAKISIGTAAAGVKNKSTYERISYLAKGMNALEHAKQLQDRTRTAVKDLLSVTRHREAQSLTL